MQEMMFCVRFRSPRYAFQNFKDTLPKRTGLVHGTSRPRVNGTLSSLCPNFSCPGYRSLYAANRFAHTQQIPNSIALHFLFESQCIHSMNLEKRGEDRRIVADNSSPTTWEQVIHPDEALSLLAAQAAEYTRLHA